MKYEPSGPPPEGFALAPLPPGDEGPYWSEADIAFRLAEEEAARREHMARVEAAVSAGIGRTLQSVIPLATVLTVIMVLWYGFAAWMNASLQRDLYANAGRNDFSAAELINDSLNMERPKLPAPHQIARELYRLIIETPPESKRGLIYHAAITLEETLIGFVIGAALGAGLAVTIVFVKMLERSLMPWIVASQTVPIIALAPMIVVILNQFDIGGMTPKAVIAAYLSFFPITVGIAKGLRSPETLQLDLMRTYSATPMQTLFKLRAPASAPFFFASMKIGAAAALVGAVVAEVTKSEDGGLGARLLAGSYYGQTVQIWAALFTAAALSGLLVGAIGLIGRFTLRRMAFTS